MTTCPSRRRARRKCGCWAATTTVALHRFQPKGGTEQLWLASGEAAGRAALRLPLDVINVSSGFGLRTDPLDKPGPPMGPLADPAPVAAALPPEPPPPPKEEPLPRPRRPSLGGLSAFGGARDVFDSGRPDFHRRRAEPEPLPEIDHAGKVPTVYGHLSAFAPASRRARG